VAAMSTPKAGPTVSLALMFGQPRAPPTAGTRLALKLHGCGAICAANWALADTMLHMHAQAGAAVKSGKVTPAGKPKPDPKAFKLQVRLCNG
jgi:hypothetical protein